MKTTIVTGMLGAGKTTFIQSYLKNTGEKALVLVNDFGKVGIDGELISQINPDTIELPSGCVCCTLKYDLINTLKRIINDISPEQLLIEPSGIASVSGIVDALYQTGISEFTIITVVDSVDFLDFYHSGMYGDFFEDQIKNADIILINKIDLVEADVIRKTGDTLSRLNPSAIIIPTVKAKITIDIPSPHGDRRRFSNNGHLHLKSIAINLPDGIDRDKTEQLFNEFRTGRFGNVVRAKALIRDERNSYLIDIASKKCFTRRLPEDVSRSRMVVIVTDSDMERVISKIRKWLSNHGMSF